MLSTESRFVSGSTARWASPASCGSRRKRRFQSGTYTRWRYAFAVCKSFAPTLSHPLPQPVLGGLKRTLHAPLGLRRMGRDPLEVQLLQGPANLGQLLFRSIPVMAGPRRDLKQAGLIGVDRYRSPVLFPITTQLPQVLFGRIMTHETRRQSRPSIIDHRDQVQFFAPPFQPIVITPVPLYQFAVPRSPAPPDLRGFDPRSPTPPQLGLDQPLA